MSVYGICVSLVLGIFLAVIGLIKFPPDNPLPYEKISCQDFVNQQTIFNQFTYSSKTGYSFSASVSDESEYNGCTASKMYVVGRHGTRFPKRKHIIALDDMLAKFDKLNMAVPEQLHLTNPFDIVTESQLTIGGMKENYCLAKRFQMRFPGLFPKEYSKLHYTFRATSKERTITSALSFARGLFENTGPLNGYQPIQLEIGQDGNNTLFRFFDNCPRYITDSKKNQTLIQFINRFLSTQPFLNVLAELQMKIDKSGELWNVTAEDALVIYDICSIEMGIYRHSNWCSFFSNESLKILEYYKDMDDYWRKGYGNDINWQMSCPLVCDIITTLNQTTSPPITLNFAHAETLVSLICAFGLHKDIQPLSPNEYKAHRNFSVSTIAPLAGNIQFVLYNCPTNETDEKYVRILHNEVPVPINHPSCSFKGDLCPLHEMTNIISDITNGAINQTCSHWQICNNNN